MYPRLRCKCSRPLPIFAIDIVKAVAVMAIVVSERKRGGIKF
jgi:hypothetical protein